MKGDITTGTKEWADRNVNCVKGCENDCRYCYAKMMAKRFGRATDETWKNMEIRYSVVNKSFRKYDGRIMFPSSHDFSNIPEVRNACFEVMGKLLDVGNEILITTKAKPTTVRRIIKRFSAFKKQIQFRFTITSYKNGQLSFWEPNAPSFGQRFRSLKLAYENGYKTSVSIEPFLDHNPVTLVKMIIPYVTESIWVGPMNYIPRKGIAVETQSRYEAVRATYDIRHLKEIYDDLKNIPIIRFKDSLTNRLRAHGYL